MDYQHTVWKRSFHVLACVAIWASGPGAAHRSRSALMLELPLLEALIEVFAEFLLKQLDRLGDSLFDADGGAFAERMVVNLVPQIPRADVFIQLCMNQEGVIELVDVVEKHHIDLAWLKQREHREPLAERLRELFWIPLDSFFEFQPPYDG